MTGIDRHVSAAHMVLGKDLNPHDTLFAGQAASYMIECGFLAVQSFLNSGHIVCLGLDGLRFLRPVRKGDTIDISSTVVYAGRTYRHDAALRRGHGGGMLRILRPYRRGNGTGPAPRRNAAGAG